MKFLPGLSYKAAARGETAAVGGGVRRALGALQVTPGQPYRAGWGSDRAITDGLDRVIWVNRAVDAVCTKLSGFPIVHRQGTDRWGGEVVESKDALLPRLNVRANVYETGPEFRYRLTAFFILSSKGVWVEVIRSRAGDILDLHVCDPAITDPLPDPEKYVTGVQMQLSDGPIDVPLWYDEKKHIRRLVYFRKNHPRPFTSLTPLEAAGISIDLDFWSRVYNRNFLLNDGRPGGLLAIKGEVEEDDAAELRRRMAGGPSLAGRTSVIEADDVNYVDLAVRPRDMQYEQLRRLTKEELLVALGTPESVLGNASGKTFDNADAERYSWLLDTVLPILGTQCAVWDLLSEGGEEDDQVVGADLSSEPILERAARMAAEKEQAEVEGGLRTINEWREARGLEPFDDVHARALHIQSGKTAIPATPEDAEELKAAAPGAAPGGGPGAPSGDAGGAGDEAPGPAGAAEGGAPSGNGVGPEGLGSDEVAAAKHLRLVEEAELKAAEPEWVYL